MSLTSRQLEILNFIQEWIRERGFPPSHGDLADHFRFNRNAAREHLLALARKGALELSPNDARGIRSEEHTSELQSLMRISYAVFCLKKQQRTDAQTSKENEVTH